MENCIRAGYEPYLETSLPSPECDANCFNLCIHRSCSNIPGGIKKTNKTFDRINADCNQNKKSDLNIRFSYDKKNEYGQLAESFNSMLDELHATEEELRVNNEELLESKQELEDVQIKYNQALESAKDIVWEWKIDTKELFVSEHWNIMFSGEPILNIVKRVPFEQLMTVESMEEFEGCLNKLIKKEETNIIFEFPFYNQKDEVSWY